MNNNIKSNETHDEEHDIKDFDLYKILIDELRKLHTSWIDNFRVILTFNSILLPGTLAIFVYISRGEITTTNSRLIISTISLIGMFVTFLGIILIRRIRAIMKLRQCQIRKLELHLFDKIAIAPFWEGYKFFGGKIDTSINKDLIEKLKNIKFFKFSKINAFGIYVLICISFILGYLLLLIISVKGIK